MRTRLLASLAALFLAASAHATSQEHVVNGGFESTAVASGSWVNVSSIPGWTVVGGPGTGFEVRNNAVGTAHGGSNFVELDTNGNTTIQQSFGDLVAGASYDLSFWYSPRIGVAADTNGISVYWNGTSLAGTITAAGGNANAWTQYHFSVTAVAGSNTLSFASMGASDSLGGNLDDVSLMGAVPEPSSALLMGSALALLVWARRRRT